MENSRLTCCELLSRPRTNLSAVFVQDIYLWTHVLLVIALSEKLVAFIYVLFHYIFLIAVEVTFTIKKKKKCVILLFSNYFNRNLKACNV